MEEGYPTNKHPLFKGIKYDYWQERIIAHFESMHIDMWDVPGHFKSKCPDLETSKDKKKYFKSKDKKGLMNTWDDLNDTSSDEEGEEEANICIMVETTSEESKSDQDDEDFEKICKDHKELEKALHGKVVVSMDESTKDCDAYQINNINDHLLATVDMLNVAIYGGNSLV
ncbi:hypothetical protein JHK85_048577 [Glycine max]|nr:hypothetical protein JHK85_048577 [Glycine max]